MDSSDLRGFIGYTMIAPTVVLQPHPIDPIDPTILRILHEAAHRQALLRPGMGRDDRAVDFDRN